MKKRCPQFLIRALERCGQSRRNMWRTLPKQGDSRTMLGFSLSRCSSACFLKVLTSPMVERNTKSARLYHPHLCRGRDRRCSHSNARGNGNRAWKASSTYCPRVDTHSTVATNDRCAQSSAAPSIAPSDQPRRTSLRFHTLKSLCWLAASGGGLGLIPGERHRSVRGHLAWAVEEREKRVSSSGCEHIACSLRP